ncbi:endonuclease domain-containing protein [Mobilicoccus pelagius]|uniref:DUF559 domain-containing protein n=1 Tax=Mobilicoccus pelagius NBRC 104925 TaxID=1089455 RepID=H5UR65_9MICO|nr:hypothetical protein [Mobilicoccus pelagius]GAB48223.1 hypothetical protein MOPEL_067_00720 [Mobilicoccus pelagius NBRC 104925]
MPSHPDPLPPPPARRSRDADALVAYVETVGGIADRRRVRRRFTAGALRGALEDGRIRPVGRSGLASASAAADLVAARRVGGVLSHRSAAAWWGWPLLDPPAVPDVAVRRGTNVRALRRGCAVHWLSLRDGEVRDGATPPLRTVLDCAASLPFDQALAVADGALRSGLVEKGELVEAADTARGCGAGRRRRVAAAADGRAANPFESALRATLLDVPGLHLQPQFAIRGPRLPGGVDFAARVDLADPVRRIVVEADSFEYHGGRDGLRRDAVRYDELVARGWRVVRVTYDDLRGNPEWVRAVVQAVVDGLSAGD